MLRSLVSWFARKRYYCWRAREQWARRQLLIAELEFELGKPGGYAKFRQKQRVFDRMRIIAYTKMNRWKGYI